MGEKTRFRGNLMVISGFSGSGKDTVAKELVQRDGWEMVVTCNAGRGPRPGETHGVDYYFVSREEFFRMKEDGELLEHVVYGETLKGTAVKEIVEKLESGRKIIWRIDPTAAARVDQIFREKMEAEIAEGVLARTIVIFLRAESEEVLFERAKKRNMDGDDEVILKRILEDTRVWEQLAHKFPNVVVNREGELESTLSVVRTIASGIMV